MNKFATIAALGAAAMTAFAAQYAYSAEVPLRGVVEGYYGRPWGTEGRLSLLKFMGENGMNVFVYGPKDDPYHHAKWREPYPEAALKDFARLLAAARQNGVALYWAVHLGDGFKKGCEADFDALYRKLGGMYDAGFRAFAVFFDDFGGADAAFHAEICNRVVADFLATHEGCERLIMCPNVYWGFGHPYQRTLGEKLDASVHVMWTGRGVCDDIRADDVRRITADLKRPPFIWWNWPVNDYCRSHLLLGRTYGLGSAQIAGLVSNPMENCEASKIALYGIAKWCLDPERFDSKATWEESFAKLYPEPDLAHAMRLFAEHNSDQGPTVHGYRREESVSEAELCAKARRELKESGAVSEGTELELRRLFFDLQVATEILKRLPADRSSLGWEIEGWVQDELILTREAFAAIELLGGRAVESHLNNLKRFRKMRSANDAKHIEKFAAATFGADRRNIRRPEASTRELRPLVESLVVSALKKVYAERFGKPFETGAEMSAFSEAKSLPVLVARRDGKYAGLARVLESKLILPGESFGIRVPENWPTTYFHARLGTPDASLKGVIEVSKDGLVWQKLATRNNGGEMQKRLTGGEGWCLARYRNISQEPVAVKIELFKFDVTGGDSPVDALLDALLAPAP